MNSPNIGMVYVASHSFHMGNKPLEIMRAAGDRLRLVHVSDTMDHHASHGLRYITNPPGNAVRVHQHLKIGDGDVNWDEFFGGLKEIGFLDKDNTVMVSSVFAEDENAEDVSRYQLETMRSTSTRSSSGGRRRSKGTMTNPGTVQVRRPRQHQAEQPRQARQPEEVHAEGGALLHLRRTAVRL